MLGVALKMLFGDRAKYLGLVFGVAFATLLITQQGAVFVSLMARTASVIVDAQEADIWVMDPAVEYLDGGRALRDGQLQRVRGVPGIAWAVPLFKTGASVRTLEGRIDSAHGVPRMSNATTAIDAHGIVKEFGAGELRQRVLHEVELRVLAGEVTFLIGPSGCGKTTLISVLAGILTPEAGTVNVFGHDVTAMRGAALVRFRAETVGFIFQQFNLLPALTAAENASIPLLIRGEGEVAARRRAETLLCQLGMEAHVAKFPSQLSGGQQQRIAIARALVHEPRLIVCDEPTASLDAASGQTAMKLLRESALRPDRAVLVVTHDSRIYPFADRIARMADGRVAEVRENRKNPLGEVA
jgi:putative ABC transport system ATP-binding protein